METTMGGVGEQATEAAGAEGQATEMATEAAGAEGQATEMATEAAGAEATEAADMGAGDTGNLCTLMAHMSGASENHDPDGTGTGYFTFNLDTNEVCYKMQVANIVLPATNAHIHIGGPGVDGPPVVPLGIPDDTGYVEGCASEATAESVAAILADPFAYYVNVHTSDFPDGAIRGQLMGTFALSGAAGDLPAEGDVNARGTAFATLNRETSELCYGFWTEGLSAPATGAALFAGESGQEGQSALDLTLPGEHGLSSACVPVDQALFDQIEQNPQGYHFGLTSDTFPSGALRGQWPPSQTMGGQSQ